jgi:hypothetical protein
MEFYFVTSGKNETEINVIKELKPKRLIASFHYFKNIDLGEFIKLLGYKPKILLDSGAYSAWNSGKKIDLDKYIDYIKRNKDHIWRYICLDKLGDNEQSYQTYLEMRKRGLKPVPVFHYLGDEKILEKYIEDKEEFIALGGTVPIKNKSEVAEWVKMICWMYPQSRFHLLGSSSRKILDHCDIESADSATWIIGAFMGNPKHIPGKDKESKRKRAYYNMNELIKLYG